MTDQIKPELDLPDGYELAESKPRLLNKGNGDKYYLTLCGEVREVSLGHMYPHFILRKVEPVWKWPKWLKGNFLVRTPCGDVLLYQDKPTIVVSLSMDKSWASNTPGWVVDLGHIDIEWPKFDTWRDSLVKKSDCEIV